MTWTLDNPSHSYTWTAVSTWYTTWWTAIKNYHLVRHSSCTDCVIIIGKIKLLQYVRKEQILILNSINIWTIPIHLSIFCYWCIKIPMTPLRSNFEIFRLNLIFWDLNLLKFYAVFQISGCDLYINNFSFRNK